MVQVWFRCGSGVVQVWFKYGSGVVQVWFKCSSGIVPSRDAAAWLITRTAWVLRVWFRCCSGVVPIWLGVVQVWFKSSSGFVPSRDAAAWLITRSARVLQVWFRSGSGVVQVWCKYGSIVVQGGSSAGALPAHLRLSSRATQACSFARASPDRARYVGAAAPTSLWRSAPFVAPEPTTAPDPARAWGPWQRATAPCPGCAPAPRWSRWSAQYRAPHGDVDAVSTPGNRARRHGSRNV